MRFRRLGGQGGFSFAELLGAMAISALVLVAALNLLDAQSSAAMMEQSLANAQQSLRAGHGHVVRMVRMAGRGTSVRGSIPQAFSVGVVNDVPESGPTSTIALGDADSPRVLAGTDVITVRGHLRGRIFQLNPAGNDFNLLGDGTGGWLTIRSPNPTTGIPQEAAEIVRAVEEGIPEALVLVSTQSDLIHAVVELDPDGPNTDVSDPSAVTIDFKITGGIRTTSYSALTPGGSFPAALVEAAFVGVLEEYRYYIRDVRAIESDPTSRSLPRLAQARFFPGTEEAHPSDPSLDTDVAEDVHDLQAALGIDLDGDGVIADAGDSNDEWLFNHSADQPNAPAWNTPGDDPPDLFYVRVSTLVRTGQSDPGYVSPPIEGIEDRDYSEPQLPVTPDERADRAHRRRLLQTVVDLRNL